jgi:serine/threonine-protein kinase
VTVPDSTSAKIGRLVADRYRLIRRIGGGAMGDVFEAVHTFTRNHVAVKVLHGHVTADPTTADRFLREARAASDIRHPAIVDVLDAGRDRDKSLYLVLQLLEGEDMASAMKRGDLTEREIVDIGAQPLEGLGAAHARGIVHRDVKPENIFLTRDDHGELWIKILDFGIAKPPQAETRLASTQKGAILGTPYYMSPEQALGDAVDHRSDLWSAGAVLYHALTGQPPFDDESYGRLTLAIIGKPHTPVATLRPSTPAWLNDAVERALQKRAEDRWPSAQAFAAALAARGAEARVLLDWTEEENLTVRSPSPFDEESLPPPLRSSPPPQEPAIAMEPTVQVIYTAEPATTPIHPTLNLPPTAISEQITMPPGSKALRAPPGSNPQLQAFQPPGSNPQLQAFQAPGSNPQLQAFHVPGSNPQLPAFPSPPGSNPQLQALGSSPSLGIPPSMQGPPSSPPSEFASGPRPLPQADVSGRMPVMFPPAPVQPLGIRGTARINQLANTPFGVQQPAPPPPERGNPALLLIVAGAIMVVAFGIGVMLALLLLL